MQDTTFNELEERIAALHSNISDTFTIVFFNEEDEFGEVEAEVEGNVAESLAFVANTEDLFNLTS